MMRELLNVVIHSHSCVDGNCRTQLGPVSRLLLAAELLLSDSDSFSDFNGVRMLLVGNNLTSVVLDFT